MTEIRLVATDLDGTLLGPDGWVSDETVEALRRAHDAGIVIVAATGRSHWTAAPRLEPTGVIDLAVCSNGATVYDVAASTVLRRRPIGDTDLGPLIDLLRAAVPDVGFAWEDADGFGEEAAFDGLGLDRRLERRARWHRIDRLGEGALPVGLAKLLVGHPELVSDALLDRVRSVVPASVTVSCSGAPFVEVTGTGVDKATTLALVCADLDIAPAEVLAVGDQVNDLDMLRWAGRPVAMGNAHPMVKAEIVEHTASNADHGVARVLDALTNTR